MRLLLLPVLLSLATILSVSQVLYPTDLYFDSVVVGLVYTKTLTIVNTTTKTIYPTHGTCTGIGEIITEAPLPDSIEAGDTVEFVLKLRPTAVSPLDYGCGIVNNSQMPGKSWAVGYAIRGTIKAGATFSMSSNMLDYGEVGVGDTATKLFFIVNTGSGQGTVGLRSFASDEFTCSLDSGTVVLDPLDTLHMNVLYHPTQEGLQTDALLFDMSDKWWTPRTVVLSGTGTPAKPGVLPSLSSVAFPSAPIEQTTSATVELSVTSGSATVTEIYAQAGDVFSVRFPPVVPASLPYVVQPGSPFVFDVVAKPTATGLWKDTIVVRTREFTDLRIPVEANAVISHVNEYSTPCQPHPNPSNGSATWCAAPLTSWVITDLRGVVQSSLTADADGVCSVTNMANGTYIIRSVQDSTTHLLIVVR